MRHAAFSLVLAFILLLLTGMGELLAQLVGFVTEVISTLGYIGVGLLVALE